MKLCTPQVVWHSKDPIYSVDFHYLKGSEWRLASAGTDKDVKVWKIIKQDGKIKLEFMSHLSRHTKPVNVVRFSPDGSMLASGSDDGTICVWAYNEEGQSCPNFGEDEIIDREVWNVCKTLRGHLEDVYDLCWSPNSAHMLSCSFDESVIMWDVQKGVKLKILRDSKQPSQGVCWDPRGTYFATLSRDRCLRVYSTSSMKLVSSVSRLSVPSAVGGGGHKVKMYHDEGMRSFFRRLAYTPDGSLLITPAGCIDSEDTKQSNTTYVFSRELHDRPLLHLPVSMPTVAVRPCPILFEPRELPNGVSSLIDLPYVMVFAVASMDSVYFYNTQQHTPFGYVTSIHYANLTDLTWSSDGATLVVSSSDGYCSFVMFEENELGIPLTEDKLPDWFKQVPSCDQRSEVCTATISSPTTSTALDGREAELVDFDSRHNSSEDRQLISETTQITNTEGTTQITDTEGTTQITNTEGTTQITNTEGTTQTTNTEGTTQTTNTEGTTQITNTEGTTQITNTEGTTQITNTEGTTQITDTKGTTQITNTEGTTQITDTKGTTQITDTEGTTQITDTKGTTQITNTEGTTQTSSRCTTTSFTDVIGSTNVKKPRRVNLISLSTPGVTGNSTLTQSSRATEAK